MTHNRVNALYVPFKRTSTNSEIELSDGTILKYDEWRINEFLRIRGYNRGCKYVIPIELQKDPILLQKVFELIHEKRFYYGKLNTQKDELDLLLELIEVYKLSNELGFKGLIMHLSYTTFNSNKNIIKIISKKRREDCNTVLQLQINYDLCIMIINRFECISENNLCMLPNFVDKYLTYPDSDDFMKTIKQYNKTNIPLYQFIVDNVADKVLVKYKKDYYSVNNNCKTMMYDYLDYVLNNDLSITITQLRYSIEIICQSLGCTNKTRQILISKLIGSGTAFIEYLMKSNIDLCEFNYFDISANKWFEIILKIIKLEKCSNVDSLTGIILGANDFGGKRTIEIVMKILLEEGFDLSKYHVLSHFHYGQKVFSQNYKCNNNINNHFSLANFDQKLMDCLFKLDNHGKINVNEFKINCTSLKNHIIDLFTQKQISSGLL